MQAFTDASRLVPPDVKTLSRLGCGRALGEEDSDRGARPECALSGHAPAVCFHEMSDDGESKSCPARLARPASVGAVEPLEDPRQVLGGNPPAGASHDP